MHGRKIAVQIAVAPIDLLVFVQEGKDLQQAFGTAPAPRKPALPPSTLIVADRSGKPADVGVACTAMQPAAGEAGVTGRHHERHELVAGDVVNASATCCHASARPANRTATDDTERQQMPASTSALVSTTFAAAMADRAGRASQRSMPSGPPVSGPRWQHRADQKPRVATAGSAP
jgi:hypothetical protein